MQYHTTEPELFYTSNRGHQFWGSCSYPEKTNPDFMIHMWHTFDYINFYPKDICEKWILLWELISEKEKWVRNSIQKVIPEWKRDY